MMKDLNEQRRRHEIAARNRRAKLLKELGASEAEIKEFEKNRSTRIILGHFKDLFRSINKI